MTAGRLAVCATPIGNLEDASPRLLSTLRGASAVYAEDTRRTRELLSAHGIRARLVSCHSYNERRRVPEVLARLAAGETVALVTDAGTPGISDPGAAIVRAAAEAGYDVQAVPGPSAVTAALSVSGFPAVPFSFLGFLPRRPGPRRRLLSFWRDTGVTLVLFEAPGRLAELLTDVADLFGPGHPVVFARELTKRFERVERGPAAEVLRRVSEEVPRGECTLVIAPRTGGGAGAGPA
ncbi:MAG: 16S rRNA (cytidine(1402)-2'-O)-methyltransferase [Clostridia bacterium]|nr:16S rRNA (cytidine(1402)-2'-O)-methyltransferase [Clostridia bacterium]